MWSVGNLISVVPESELGREPGYDRVVIAAALGLGAATAAVREHVQAKSERKDDRVEDIVLTQAYFEAALEELRADDDEDGDDGSYNI